MNPTSADTFPALSRLDRARAMSAAVLCGLVILFLGTRTVLLPADPQGAVSVLSSQAGWMAIPLCAAAAFGLAMLVTWLTRGRLEELGLFAVAVGLSLVAARYSNATYLWLELGHGDDGPRARLATWMALETLGWTAVMAIAWGACVWSTRGIGRHTPQARGEWRRGALTILISSAIAAVLLPLFSTGTQLTPIHTGQVYFACAASFYLAALVAQQITLAHSPLWSLCSVVLVALGGFVYTALQPTPQYPGRLLDHLATFPPTSFGRALPIQIIMVGTAAVVFANWHLRQMTRFAAEERVRPT